MRPLFGQPQTFLSSSPSAGRNRPVRIRPAVWLLIAGLLALATVAPGWAVLVCFALPFLLIRKR